MQEMTQEQIDKYAAYLYDEEKSAATIEKYTRALQRFLSWLPAGKTLDKSLVIAYKQQLMQRHAPTGVNGALAALNGFFRYTSRPECIVRPLRVQRRVFASAARELSRAEYLRLVQAAQKKRDERLSLLLQLMAGTGVRVSEIRYVTAEALESGCVSIALKGKIRTILLPGKLLQKLKRYQRDRKITSGPLFLTREGRSMDRREIWAQMKRLCRAAGVSPEKVFPHNLRHLFARAFYSVQRDIARLADVLGHSSIETTRIYLLSSGVEHRHTLERLRLIC